MLQPSLAFLSLPIPAAMELLGSFRTFKHLPVRLVYGLLDMAEALMNCFPDAAAEYYDLMENADHGFNFAAEAYRVLSPAVEQATYPLYIEEGALLADTPLAMALSPRQAMHLLKECVGHEDHLDYEPDADALFDMTQKLIDGHPSIKAELDILLDEGGFDYYSEAYKLLTAAMKADRPQLALAA